MEGFKFPGYSESYGSVKAEGGIYDYCRIN